MGDMRMSQNQAATVIIFPTLWSGPWIWREQEAMLRSFASRRLLVEKAMANWPVEPSLEALDAHVLKRIDAAAPPWLLVGASLGGLLALRVSARLPHKVAGVIASGCPGLGPGGEIGMWPHSPPTPEEARLIRSRIFVDPACLGDDDLTSSVAEVAGRDAVRRAVRLLRVLNAHDASDMLRALKRPAELIWGSRDRLTPGSPWRRLARGHRYMRFRTIAGAGHVPMLEAPERFAAALAAVWPIT